MNLRFALASTFKFAKMFRTIESPITRALSSGFSVGASLSGENLFNVLIRTEEQCFDFLLCRLTVTQLPCCRGAVIRTEQCKGLPELVASKAVSTALTFLLSSIKVWMRVSKSDIFCQPNYFPALITCESLTADRESYTTHVASSASDNIRRSHYSPWLLNDSDLPQLFELVKMERFRLKWMISN